MGKKLLVFLLSLTAIATAVFGLTACGGDGGSCEHNFETVVQAKAPTCTEDGSYTVQKCADCGIYYLPNSFDEFNTEVDALDKAFRPKTTHFYEFVPKQEASSCSGIGYLEHKKCKYCDKIVDNKDQPLTLEDIKVVGKHSPEYQSSSNPTCEREGKSAHYKCNSCQKLFSDYDCTIEITEQDVIVEAKGHDFEHEYSNHYEYVAPTCEEGGSKEAFYCWVCGKLFDDNIGTNQISDLYIPPLNHDLSVITVEVEADCEIDEVIRHSCSRQNCNYYEEFTTPDSALTHVFENGVCTNCECDEFSVGLQLQKGYYSNDYTVVGLGTWETKDVLIIPNTYKGVKVEAVHIQDSSSLEGVKKIILPENVKSAIFPSNNTVTEVVIKSSEFDFKGYSFSGFTALEGFTVPENFVVKGVEYNAFMDCLSLLEFDFDGTYEQVGYGAFTRCSSLEKVSIPSTVTFIDGYAFKDCASLTEIYIPSSVTQIGTYTFENCTSLEKVIIDDVKDWAKIRFSNTESSNPLYYAHYLYRKTATGSEYYGDIILDSNIINEAYLEEIKQIKQYVFTGCYNLVKIVLPLGVTKINEGAFKDCIYLEEVQLYPKGSYSSSSLTDIATYAFKGCTSLTSLTYPSSVSVVGNEAFMGCEAISAIYYSTNNLKPWLNTNFNHYTSNPMYAGNSTVYLFYLGQYLKPTFIDLTPAEIDGVKQPYSLKKNIFAGCNEKIEGIEYLNYIGEYAFYNAKGVNGYLELDGVTGMSDYYFPRDFYGATQIGAHAFDGCVNLGDVRLSQNLIAVGDYAFANSGITSLYMMSQNAAVGSHLLENCERIDTLQLAFFGKNSEDNYYYKLSYYFGENKIPASLKTLNVASGNYRSDSLKGANNLTTIYLPNNFFMASDALGYRANPLSNLTIIYAGSLEEWIDNYGLGDDTLSSNITLYVYDYENEQYDLVDELVIPETVTSNIGNTTFAYVTSITKVVVHANFRFSSGAYTFYGCKNLLEVYNYTNTTLTLGSSSNNYIAYYAAAIYTSEDEDKRVVTTADGFIFGVSKVEDGETPEVTLYGYRGVGGDIELPSSVEIAKVTYNSYKVGSNAFNNNANITSVIVPSSVKALGSRVFYNCSSLRNVTLSEGLESIGERAFYQSGIFTLVIPNSVTTVDDNIVDYCENLYKLTIGENCDNFSISFYSVDRLFEIVDLSGNNNNFSSEVKVYGTESKLIEENGFVFYFDEKENKTYLIAYDGDETELTLPTKNEPYVINDYFLYNDKNITKVIIPDCVIEIGREAFYGSNITEIDLGNGITKIGYNAFYNLSNELEEVVLPASLLVIDSYAFNYTDINKLVLKENFNAQINFYAFLNIKEVYAYSLEQLLRLDTEVGLFAGDFDTKLYINGELVTELNITGSQTNSVLDNAFAGITVNKITIDGVNYIGEKAFAWIDANEVVIKDVEEIKYNAFVSAKIKKLTIENVAYIGDSAFTSSTVESITLTNVQVVGPNAFRFCNNISNLVLGEGILMIDAYAFENVNLEVDLPSTLIYYGTDAVTGVVYSEYKGGYYYGNKQNPYLVLVKAGFENGSATLEIHPNCKIIGGSSFYDVRASDIKLHEGIVSIGNSAFYSNENLSTITLPSTLKIIGNNAFGYTNITSIKIPKSVEYIGEYAFESCSYLQNLEFEEGIALTKIEDYAFYRCGNLTKVTIPDSVVEIGFYAFEEIGIIELTIGSNLKYVDQSFGHVLKLNVNKIEDYLNIEFTDSSSQFLYEYSKENYGKIFVNGVELTEVIVPNTVSEISAYAFYNNPYITKLVCNENVTTIGERAFYGANNLATIDLTGVKTIGEYSFAYCTGLTTATMPDIESIAKYSLYFYDYNFTSKLTSIELGANLRFVGERAFYDRYYLEVNFLGTVNDWAMIEFENEEANPAYYGNQIKFNGQALSDIVISANEVKAYTFYNNEDITSITLTDNVQKVGKFAFYVDVHDYIYSNLTSLTIGNGVTEIEEYAFAFASKVETITLGSKLESIGEYAFYSVGSDISVGIDVSGLENVKYVGYCGFAVNVKELNLSSLIYADKYAFAVRTNFLTKIILGENFEGAGDNAFNFTGTFSYELIYLGDIEDFENMEFGNETANPVTKATTVKIDGVDVTDQLK